MSNNEYCLYLRKSRADAEAEERGEGETLARHERALLELAKKLRLNVTQIYREIVSGETIAARPVMQQLLSEVEQGMWAGVLVMEVERLARGDTVDQGLVAQTFKYSNTKIITPVKTYDPNNEFDEEYFEFGLFMSRREYKTINRRLQRGRVASIKEGKYVANRAPYGYERVRIANDKGWTLKPVPNEADIVKLIYELYTVGEKLPDNTFRRLGVNLIARRLNEMKIKPKKGGDWVNASIRDILINPVYIGKVRWNWRHNVKKMVDGQIRISRPRSEDIIVTQGIHPPIITEETFNLAQELMKQNPPRPISEKKTVKNPLAGIVVCGVCGRRMVRRPYTNEGYPDTLMCSAPTCSNVSSHLHIVEERILRSIENWLGEYKMKWQLNNEQREYSQVDIKQKALDNQRSELDTLYKQLSKTHDLLEQGIYDTDTFLDRSRSLSERINSAQTDIAALEKELEVEIMREDSAINIVPKVEHLLEVYRDLTSAKAKNDMLKDVLEKVVYVKKSSTRWHGSPDDFEITLYPKIPTIHEK